MENNVNYPQLFRYIIMYLLKMKSLIHIKGLFTNSRW